MYSAFSSREKPDVQCVNVGDERSLSCNERRSAAA